VAEDSGATGRTLADEIRRLFEEGVIVQTLCDISTEIGVFVNYGAHPPDDLLREVDEDLCRQVLYFTEELGDDLYVNPGAPEEMRRRRSVE
jgi:hypothetical protein